MVRWLADWLVGWLVGWVDGWVDGCLALNFAAGIFSQLSEWLRQPSNLNVSFVY